MVTVGSLVRFEIKPGKAADFERFLKASLIDIQEAPGTPIWLAFRLGPTTFGVFDAFPDEGGRQAHFLAGAVRAEQASDLLESPPVIEEVDVLAAKLSTGA